MFVRASPERRRAIISLLDQVVSSASNFALVAVYAHLASASDFGEFVVLYTAFLLMRGLSQSLLGEPLLIKAVREPAILDEAAVTSLAAIAGLAAALATLVVGIAFRVSMTLTVTFCLTTPFLIIQDTLRFYAVAARTPTRALVSDLVWTISAILLNIFSLLRHDSALSIAVEWAATGALCGVGMVRRTSRSGRALANWVRNNTSEMRSFSLEFIVLSATSQSVPLILGATLSVTLVGALRGAQLLFSPLNTVMNGFRIALLPEMAAREGRGRRRITLVALVCLLGTTVIYESGLLLGRTSIGALILHDTWPLAKPLLPAVFVYYFFAAGHQWFFNVFRAYRLRREGLIMRSTLGVGCLLFALVTMPFGIVAVAWGLAASTLLTVCVAAFMAIRWMRRPERLEATSTAGP